MKAPSEMSACNRLAQRHEAGTSLRERASRHVIAIDGMDSRPRHAEVLSETTRRLRDACGFGTTLPLQAGRAQLVEHQLPTLRVVSLNLVSRSEKGRKATGFSALGVFGAGESLKVWVGP